LDVSYAGCNESDEYRKRPELWLRKTEQAASEIAQILSETEHTLSDTELGTILPSTRHGN
jgi:hypothetical protein